MGGGFLAKRTLKCFLARALAAGVKRGVCDPSLYPSLYLNHLAPAGLIGQVEEIITSAARVHMPRNAGHVMRF